ncbi:MAG TPA: class I SAM-dependent methyltransferase [Chitinispirillaceae bacterium]|nr:class I SAM-dependent methyltransferase [Chitinispirillaceae bacterium]
MKSLEDIVFVRTSHVCPWWLCWSFDNMIRKAFHNPYRILSQHIRKGDTVVDIGCGMGYFSIPMALMVGQQGKVVAIDLQKQMLDKVKKRAEKAGVTDRIVTQQASKTSLVVQTKADFALAFWMIHEVPDRQKFLSEIRSLLKKGGKLLIVEPRIHVSKMCFQETLKIAEQSGFKRLTNHKILFSYACLFEN